MTKTLRVAACLTGALILAGCGDDRPVSDPGPQPVYQSPAPVAAVPEPPNSMSDPLLPSGGPASDPLIQPDPLLGTGRRNEASSSESDPLQGRAMLTEHSHWLRGRVQGAKLTVRLNGVREGDYLGYVDKDITMKLRAGINTVSFEYTPRGMDASAQMDLVESEHHPDIAPLASFQSAPPTGEDAKPATQTFTFFAH